MKHGKMSQKSRDIRCYNAIASETGGIDMTSLGISLRGSIKEGLEVWLYKYKKIGVKSSTFERLVVSYNLALRYTIMYISIVDLQTSDIQEFINRLRTDGYGYNIIKKAYNLLTAFLKFLIGEGLPVRPSYINVVLPSSENTSVQTGSVEAYSKTEQFRLIKEIQPDNTLGSKAALLMLETGIRSGETLALSWKNIDWDRRALTISKTLVHPASTKRCFIQHSPKSKASRRTIPLSSRAYAMLESLYESTMPQDDDLIFHSADNPSKSMGYNLMSNQIKRLCERANVPYKGLHIFRHTFATNCYYKGCEIKILSKLLGHSSVTVTYNTYIHLYGDALDEMRSVVE